MIDFQEEFGYPLTWKIEAKFHRCGINKKCQGYNKYTLIPIKYWSNSFAYWRQPISFKEICKKCLSTFTKQEIKDFKFWLIVRKLKN